MNEVYLSRAGNLGPIVEYLVQAGQSPEQLFYKVALSPEIITQPELLITQRDLFIILAHAARVLDDPVFGARLGNLLSLDDLGHLGALLAVAPTAQAGIDFANCKVEELVQNGTVLELEVSDAQAIWSYRSLERATIGREQDALLSLGFLLAAMENFQAPGWLPTAVIVPDTMRSSKSALEDLYGFDVRCGGDQFAIMFDKDLLNTPGFQFEVNSFELENVSRLGQPLPNSDDVAAITQCMCVLERGNGMPNLERVAARMGMTPRTLQRRLREQGKTFRQSALTAIMKQANTLIAESNWPISQIAMHVGYAETSQFSRAYKSWVGISPAEMRRFLLA